MIRPLIILGFSSLVFGCAPRFAGTHFDRWAKEDLARREASLAPPPSPTPTPAPAPPAPPSPPAPAAPSAYPAEPGSGTTTPDDESEAGGRVVRPAEDDEVLY